MLSIVELSLRKLMRCNVAMCSCLCMCVGAVYCRCWEGKMSTLHEGWIWANKAKSVGGGESVTSTDGVDMAMGSAEELDSG